MVDPYFPDDFLTRTMQSSVDVLILGIDTAILRLNETILDITEVEYHWEPLSEAERQTDLGQPAESKRVWRVFEVDGHHEYDYGERTPGKPAFTTIAWIMNHTAVTAAMYLHCIKAGQYAGNGINWWDLPVQSNLNDMRSYLFQSMQDTKNYLLTLENDPAQLNRPTPAPWGGIRPMFLNLWGGIIEHTIQHSMQIAVRKEYIRHQF